MTPWEGCASRFGHVLVAEVRRLIEVEGVAELEPATLARDTNEAEGKVHELLDELDQKGVIRRRVTYRCVCGQELSAAEYIGQQCVGCQRRFDEMNANPKERQRYVVVGEGRRLVPWVIAIHGMNTLGAWQEELSWRIATKYRYSAPVAIYKYGIVRSGVLRPSRQSQLVEELRERINDHCRHARREGLSERPDVICHSFGTWLFGHLLDAEFAAEHPLRFGRVILTGCILRPDYDWQRQLDGGRVEAVLNHFGTKDGWARIAHYLVPDSGPSGRSGFTTGGVVNHPTEGWRHSSFFEVGNLQDLLGDGGLWERFLTDPPSSLAAMQSVCLNPSWRASWKVVRGLARTGVLFIYFALIGLVVVALAIGAMNLIGF